MKIMSNIARMLALLTVFGSVSLAATSYPGSYYERFVIRSMLQIHSAQMTYATTSGNGNFGSLAALHQANLIDARLASGNRYRYSFVVSVTPGSPGTPASYVLTATPHHYPKTGRRSFFIDTSGELRGGNKNGGIATAEDPHVDSCTFDNEGCSIQALRTLHSAQTTFAATFGNGNFGSFTQLRDAMLIGRALASGNIHGYHFVMTIYQRTPTIPASFTVTATPNAYGVTGVRSFFIDTSGVIRGADKNGAPADENDPPIDQ